MGDGRILQLSSSRGDQRVVCLFCGYRGHRCLWGNPKKPDPSAPPLGSMGVISQVDKLHSYQGC